MKIDKNYLSPIDQKLTQFDKTHAPSASQLAEIQKYQALNQTRDTAQQHEEEASVEIWEGF